MRGRGWSCISGIAAVVALAGGSIAAHAAGSVPASPMPLAVTQGDAVVILGSTGKRTVVTHWHSMGAMTPWYAWSPDGVYLLVTQPEQNGQQWAVRLYDRHGAYLRTLATSPRSADFFPSWASNSDQIAYVGVVPGSKPARTAVYRVGITGHRSYLRADDGPGAGCGGGGMNDPAQMLWTQEVDFGAMMPQLYWTVGQRPALLGDLYRSADHPMKSGTAMAMPVTSARASSGALAGTLQHCTRNACTSSVVLLDARTGTVRRVIGPGELPTWSPDGQTLYFVRRTAVRVLSLHDAMGDAVNATVYRSATWQVPATGTQPAKLLLTENAYGFGPLTVTSDGSSLIFSRIANSTNLWAHRLAGDRITSALTQRYGPHVNVQQFDLQSGAITVVAHGAGRPAIGG